MIHSSRIVFLLFFIPITTISFGSEISCLVAPSPLFEPVWENWKDEKYFSDEAFIDNWKEKNYFTVNDQLSLRSTCKFLATKVKLPPFQLAPECRMFHYVAQGNLNKVKELIEAKDCSRIGVVFLTNCYEQSYTVMTYYSVAKKKGHAEIAKFLEEKEYTGDRIGRCTIDEIDIDLCLASCERNIEKFTQCLSADCDEAGKAKKTNSIPLVIWIAVKNGDVTFLKHLQKYDEYKDCMLYKSDKFLRFSFLGFCFETFIRLPRFKEGYCVSKTTLERSKKIIASNCFSLMKRNHDCQRSWDMRATDFFRDIVEENKDGASHQGLKEVYEFALELYEKELYTEWQWVVAKRIRNIVLIGTAGYLVWRFWPEKKE